MNKPQPLADCPREYSLLDELLLDMERRSARKAELDALGAALFGLFHAPKVPKPK